MPVSTTVLDDNIQRVRIRFRLPSGTVTTYTSGVASQVSSSGDETYWEATIDTTTATGSGPGKYGYRIEMKDSSNQFVEYPSSSTWTEFLVADNAADIVTAAREEIRSIIQTARQGGVNLAAKFVRHSFHDCVGGCDGCVDMTNGDNAGLDIPIAALEPVVDMFSHYGVTRADIWVLAGLEGAGGAQPSGDPDNRDFTMDWIGRPNCETLNTAAECVGGLCQQDRGPDRALPSPSLTTDELLDYFDIEFGFDERDTVAIMGAHTLGTLVQENSGYNGVNGWLGNTNQLGNGYYDDLVGEFDFAILIPTTYVFSII